MSSYLEQLNILLHSDLTEDVVERFYSKSLTNADIKYSQIQNLDFRIDAAKLFNYPIKLHALLNDYESKYVIALPDDYGITYGGDKLAVNFIFIGLNLLFSKIKNEDILAAFLRYKSIKHLILRSLYHLRNIKFAKHRKIKFHILDVLQDTLNSNDIDVSAIKKDLAKDTIARLHML